MSFLGDLIGSIGGEKPPVLPTQPSRPIVRPVNTNPPQSAVMKSAPSTPSTSRPVYKGTAGLGAPQQAGSLKRKAEEISTERPEPSRADSHPNLTKASTEPSSQNASNVAKTSAKPPTKGSYAALMARAKDAQSTKAPSSIGVIKHQATEKEKVKTSKLAERKRVEQEKDKKPSATGPTSKATVNGKVDPRRRSASPVKKSTAPKVASAPKPPLHGPRKGVTPSYKGTMGQAPRKSKDERSKPGRRYDDYLGTDEEEDDDNDDGYGYGDQQDYYSDESDDMEGGLSDIEAEEAVSARTAKDDDAKELALEMKLKREKEEKKRKLAAMAKKHSSR